MAEMNQKNIKVFKYNLSFYYQSTIIYFVVFLIYAIIRGEFVENSFTLITRDPIIYFFGIIVLISLVSLIYNIYKNKYLEISEENLSFVDRFKVRTFNYSDMSAIKISKRKKRRSQKKPFQLVRIKLKTRKRPLIIRPYDYENESELLDSINEIKSKIESV